MKQYVFHFEIDRNSTMSGFLLGLSEDGYKIQNILIKRVNGFGVTMEIIVVCRKKIFGIF